MGLKSLGQENIDLLTSIGFTVRSTGELCLADGEEVCDRNFDQLETMAGRVSNIRYMANAMDLYDRISQPAPAVRGGRQQFEHLLNFIPNLALIYFALRRLQRQNNLPALRSGLSLLLAFEKQQISAEDVLSILWPHGHNSIRGLLRQAAPEIGAQV